MIYETLFLYVYYDVKYSQKDDAKRRRLRWDPEVKKWYSMHRLINFHNGDMWPDNSNLCIKYKMIDFKIKNKYNWERPQSDDILNEFISIITKDYDDELKDSLKYNSD
jgi:hypothetical protein